MAQIGAFTIIIPMEALNFRGGNNLLSPPRHSSFALHSRSYTINPSSTPSSTIICQAKHQPIVERKRLGKQKPRSGNLRLEEVPTIFKIIKALAITAKLGKYSTALSQFNKLQLEDIELNLYTFGIAINCYCCVNRVGFGLSLLGTIFKRGYTPGAVIFNTLLKGLIAQDKAAEALSHFNKLQLQDIELNLYTFGIAINCYCCVNRVGFGLSLLGTIFKRGYTPGAVIFNTLLKGLIAQDKAAEALSHFNKLQLQDIELNLYTFNIAINCYCRMNRVGFGFSVLGGIFKHGYTPDAVTFTTLLNGFIAQDKVAEAVALFQKLVKKGEIKPNVATYASLEEKGVHPDVVTYNSLIHGLCSSGRWKEANGMLGEMLDIGISPDIVTFNVLVDALTKEGKAKEAEEVIESLIQRGVHPNVITYSSLMNGYCLQGQMDEAIRVLNTMANRGIQPSVRSYTILIRGYCDNMKIDEAIGLFREIPQRGLKPDLATFTTIFTGISRLGRFTVGRELLNAMELAGLTPESRTYVMLLSGLCKTGHIDEALSLFHMIENKGLGLNIVIYNVMIDAFCKNNNLESARDLFIKLSSKGLQPDLITYNIMIHGLCKEGFLVEAKELLGKMDQNGVLPDSVTYNAIIQGFVEQQKLHEALVLFEEMVGRRISPHASTLHMIKDLISTHDTIDLALQEVITKFMPMIDVELGRVGLTLNMYFASLRYTSPTFLASMVNTIASLTFVIAIVLRLEVLDLRKPRGVAKVVGTLVSLTGVMTMTLYKGPIVRNLGHPPIHLHGKTTIQENWLKGSILTAFTLKRYPAKLSLTTWMCFVGAAQSAVFTVCIEHKPAAWTIGFNIDLWSTIYGGLVMSGLVIFIQLWCTEEKGPVFVTMFNPLSTILVAVLAYFVLGERLYMGSILGGVVVIIGLYVLLWGKEGDQEEMKPEEQIVPTCCEEHKNLRAPVYTSAGNYTKEEP
ncbi:hypothetical protein RHMOL_Rhmol04G0298800 [Rhododendron molle]|uniref:Uncharacterized protein n=1 Tax=Rhododendron molle TaxID=49168 RepID=A0ACC0P8A9_RHOML|nr:hypothetical protein RHMOL_Rhmol04G0298800 [Rhododendron molle]